MNTPLQLDSYVIDVLEVTANESCATRGDATEADISLLPLVMTRTDDASKHQISLDLSVQSVPNHEPLPYEVHIKGRAFFHIEGEPAVEQNLVRFNGSAILLGLLRGVVAQITAQGPHGSFLIPPLNLVEAFEESAKLLAQAEAQISAEKQED